MSDRPRSDPHVANDAERTPAPYRIDDLDIRRRVSILYPDRDMRPEMIPLAKEQVLQPQGGFYRSACVFLVLEGVLQEEAVLSGNKLYTLTQWRPGQIVNAQALSAAFTDQRTNRITAKTDASVLPVVDDCLKRPDAIQIALDSLAEILKAHQRKRQDQDFVEELLVVFTEMGRRQRPEEPHNAREVIKELASLLRERYSLEACVNQLEAVMREREAELSAKRQECARLAIAEERAREAAEHALADAATYRQMQWVDHSVLEECRLEATQATKSVFGHLKAAAMTLRDSNVTREQVARMLEDRYAVFSPYESPSAPSSRLPQVMVPSVRGIELQDADRDERDRHTMVPGFLKPPGSYAPDSLLPRPPGLKKPRE